MKKGEVVTIYMDPITELKPEGEATLVRKSALASQDGVCEYWDVQFESDGMIVGRWIKSDGQNSPTKAGQSG